MIRIPQGLETSLQYRDRRPEEGLAEAGIISRRLRYFGYVLNLAAKVFLFGKNADAFEVEDNVNGALNREREAREAWR